MKTTAFRWNIAGLMILAFVAIIALAGPVQAQSATQDLLGGSGGQSSAEEEATQGPETVAPVPEEMEAAEKTIPGGPDYEAWAEVAEQAEEVLDEDRASSLALEEMRERLAEWRTEFQEARSANSARIELLKAQIEALGPAPAEGEEEAEELAERRKVLNAQLSRLQVPARAANEAYTHVNGLIGELDAILRERQAEQFLDIGPSPLLVTNWPEPLDQLASVADTLRADFENSWSNTLQREAFRQALPVAIALLVIGLVLVIQGRSWSMRFSERLLRRAEGSQRSYVLAMLVSVGQLVLPQVGLILIVLGVIQSGLTGNLANAVLQAIPVMGVLIFGARWLGYHSFPKVEILSPPLVHSEAQRRSGRLWATLAGVAAALGTLLAALTTYSGIDDEAALLLNVPAVLLGATALFRLGQLLVAHDRTTEGADEDDETTAIGFRRKLIHLLGRTAILFALAGPLMAVLGYLVAGDHLVFAPLATLALLAAVSLLQRFFASLYALFFGRQADGSDGLVAVLLAFVIMIAAVPLLALIWGARVADLTELWSRFLQGFSIGESQISPGDFLTFATVFVIGYMLTRLVQGALRSSVLPKTRIDTGGQNAIISGVSYIGIFLAAVIAITAAGIDLSSLAIVAGALSVGIGFGLQTVVSNFVSGIILLVERPISEGDWVSTGGVMGIVKKISVRSTRIETFDRTDVIVPNADLISGQVTNYTKTNMSGRLIVPIGAAYGSDTRKVAEILQEVAEEHSMVILNPPPQVVFIGFGADSLDFEVRVILRDVFSIITAQTEIRHRIIERFKEEGIEIPFAQRDLWLRNPEALAGAVAGGAVLEPPEGAQVPDGAGEADGSPAQHATPSPSTRAEARAGITRGDMPDNEDDAAEPGEGDGGDK